MALAPIAFEVVGVPVPQGSKTTGTRKDGGAFVREGNRERLEPWRAAVSAAAARAMHKRDPLTGPVWLDVEFVFPRPRAHVHTGKRAGEIKANAPRWHSSRPDTDKLLRAIGDALTGIVVTDDAQFAAISAEKRYGAPCVRVVVVGL
jgi:Holliday junction resolvase RusA-like endonuclease